MYHIAKFGQDKFISLYVDGTEGGYFALLSVIKPGNDSDVGAANTTAWVDSDSWVLDGTRAWITNDLHEATAVMVSISVC